MIYSDPTIVIFDWSPEGSNPINPADLFPRYRLLEDHWVNEQLFLAGTVVRADGSDFPRNWVPSPNVEPLNLLAVNRFYILGPRDLGLVRQQWERIGIPKPTTYWTEVGPNLWQLTGLGATLAPLPAIVPHPVGGYPQ